MFGLKMVGQKVRLLQTDKKITKKENKKLLKIAINDCL